MVTAKILVIGSTKHQHVKCIDWNHVGSDSVNMVDFDAVLINTRSLRPPIIRKLAAKDGNIRTSLARLWGSGGDIIVLGDALTNVDISKSRTLNNYFWSPISIGIVKEAGDTIERLTREVYSILLSI
jgi:hypothetical protein